MWMLLVLLDVTMFIADFQIHTQQEHSVACSWITSLSRLLVWDQLQYGWSLWWEGKGYAHTMKTHLTSICLLSTSTLLHSCAAAPGRKLVSSGCKRPHRTPGGNDMADATSAVENIVGHIFMQHLMGNLHVNVIAKLSQFLWALPYLARALKAKLV